MRKGEVNERGTPGGGRMARVVTVACVLLIIHTLAARAQYSHVTGRVTDPGGAGVWGVDLDVEESATGLPLDIANDHTDPDGYYDIVLPQGTFDIEYNAPAGVKLASEIRRNVTITGDTVINVTLPTGYYLSGRVTDSQGAGVGQVDLDVDDSETGERIPTPRDDTDANGNYLVVVPAGVFDVTYEPPPGVRKTAEVLPQIEVAGDVVLNVSLEEGYFLSGFVVDEGGSGVTAVDLDVEDIQTGETVPTARDNTDDTGHYSIVVPAGTFSIVFDPGTRDDLAAARLDSVVVGGDLVLETVTLLYGVSLSGTVTSSSGDPVANANLDVVDPGTSKSLPTPHDNTDASGHYQVTVPPGTYDLLMKPPPGSGLLEKLLPSVPVPNDTTVDFVLDDATGIGSGGSEETEGRLPAVFTLSQNYPNPFNPRTTITFTIQADEKSGAEGEERDRIHLEVFDLRGHRMKVLVDGTLLPGTHTVVWDGRDERGMPVSSGVYLYELRCGSYRALRKMSVMK